MRTSVTLLAFGVLALAPALGCSDDNPEDTITTRSNATADFTQYKTYHIQTASEASSVQTATVPAAVATNLEVVSNAMRTQLNQLGLQEVNADQNPDLNAFNLASTSEQTAVYWGCVGGYWYGYWAYTWDPCPWLAPMYTQYTQGTIVVGLADPKLQQVVFGGLIQGIGEGQSSSELENRINDDVAKVFDAYPANQTGSGQTSQ